MSAEHDDDRDDKETGAGNQNNKLWAGGGGGGLWSTSTIHSALAIIHSGKQKKKPK